MQVFLRIPKKTCTFVAPFCMSKPVEQIEKEKLWKRLNGRFHEACEQYGLLADGDKVLIGLSGGKDSLLLVELLGAQAKIYKPRIEVVAIHVRVAERNYQSDLTYLEQFCATHGVRLEVCDTQIVPQETENEKKEKNPCFLCAWYRRKLLLDKAQEWGCNKIALGHHRDDVLQTMLMNLIYEGRCSSIPPILPLDKMPISMIRPLWKIDERDIVHYAAMQHYQKQLHLCPFEKETSRNKAAELLAQLEQMNPEVRASLIHALERGSNDNANVNAN